MSSDSAKRWSAPRQKKHCPGTALFPFSLNERGQEGESFRLLIEAIMVVFILIIILGVINQVDAWRWRISEQQLFEGYKKALNSPDGSVITEKDLILKDGSSYTSDSFANQVAGIGAECVEIEASDQSAFTVTNKRIIEINTLIQANIYYKCVPGSSVGNDCDPFCTISFGRELEPGT